MQKKAEGQIVQDRKGYLKKKLTASGCSLASLKKLTVQQLEAQLATFDKEIPANAASNAALVPLESDEAAESRKLREFFFDAGVDETKPKLPVDALPVAVGPVDWGSARP